MAPVMLTILQINGSKSSPGTILEINGSKSSLMLDQWLQVFTDRAYIENQANIGAGAFSELSYFYAAAEHNIDPLLKEK
ncbi:unnamed protein product [Rodentolepis nana]|uniref:YozE_SAM_like domain-containing protein n=1 Tax=Rodentolepis nana TaxID=102285 RepID=A0A0R3TBH8_RODNA|nr:unnamed protein product [Rodentolepis nana]